MRSGGGTARRTNPSAGPCAVHADPDCSPGALQRPSACQRSMSARRVGHFCTPAFSTIRPLVPMPAGAADGDHRLVGRHLGHLLPRTRPAGMCRILIDVAELAAQLGGLADIEERDGIAMVGDQLEIAFRVPRRRRPTAGPHAGRRGMGDCSSRLAAHRDSPARDVELSSGRQAQVAHVADEVILVVAPPPTRRRSSVFPRRTRGDGATVSRGRVEQAPSGSGKYLLADGPVEQAGIALLEIWSASAPRMRQGAHR